MSRRATVHGPVREVAIAHSEPATAEFSMAGEQDFGGGPELEFNFAHDDRELHCFSTSPAHGEPQWAVTIGNRTFGTGLPASPDDRIERVRSAIIEWYEFEKARRTFGS